MEIELDADTFNRVVIDPLARALPVLPKGVHFLSAESEETLKRAHEKCAAAESRFVKRGA